MLGLCIQSYYMNVKIVAVIVISLLVVGAVAIHETSKDDSPHGGLYDLDATVVDVMIGKLTASPGMIDTIETLYGAVYGDEGHDAGEYSMEAIRADTDFWNKYCDYTSLATKNPDGTYDVIVKYKDGNKTVTLPVADRLISCGTMYMTTIYYLMCDEYDVEPFSDQASKNEALIHDYQYMISGGTTFDYIQGNTELSGYLNASEYLNGANSVANYDMETLASHIKTLVNQSPDVNVLFMASGVGINQSSDKYTNTVTAQGGSGALFLTASTIKDSFAAIDCIGKIMGFEDYVQPLIDDLIKRLYAVYESLQEQDDEHKIYWESPSTKAISSRGMPYNLIQFMGWDASLMTGSEVDTETLLFEKPDILIFLNTDDRTMDEKMRR